MTTARDELPQDAPQPPAVGIRIDRPVGRPVPERVGLLAQIAACRLDVAQWPEWMRATRCVPKWMKGWDD